MATKKPTPLTPLPATVVPVPPAREPQGPCAPPATPGREMQPPEGAQPGQKQRTGVVD